jgi:hypothetical protein
MYYGLLHHNIPRDYYLPTLTLLALGRQHQLHTNQAKRSGEKSFVELNDTMKVMDDAIQVPT